MRNRMLIPTDGRSIKKFRDGWVLYIHPERSGNGWVNLKLVDTISQRRPNYKRTYYLGWNGERFARNPDFHELIKRMPSHYAAIDQKLIKMTKERRFHRYDIRSSVNHPHPSQHAVTTSKGVRGVRISTASANQNRRPRDFFTSTK